jgi:two-component system chemotaxis response regulator CheY
MPTAILLDWNMPVMDGLEFLTLLRREPGGKEPVVVFCSVENDPDHISRALNAGAVEYIMKPFDSDIIESKFVEAGLL